LLFDEARAFVSNLNSDDLEHWYVWKEEWPDWRPVQGIEGLTEMIFRVMHVSPPPPPRGTETQDVSQDAQIETQSNVKNVSGKTDFPQDEESKSFTATFNDFIVRAKKRFNKRFQVTIIGENGQTFRSHTRDISVGGMNLEASLPVWVAGYFKVRIAKPTSKQLIELTCCLIESETANERRRIAILPLQSEQDEKNLETWIAAA